MKLRLSISIVCLAFTQYECGMAEHRKSSGISDSVQEAELNLPLACELQHCDTIDSYRIIFQNTPEAANDSMLRQNKIVAVNSLHGAFVLEGWHCSLCSGTEKVFIQDHSGITIDSFSVYHKDHLFHSLPIALSRFDQNQTYRMDWEFGPDFILKTQGN